MSPRPMGVGTLTILRAIAGGHRYGSDIMATTGQGGGTVYKVLRRLEMRGLIEGVWEDAEEAESERRPRRRYYRLSAEGRVQLVEAGERELASGPSRVVSPERSR